MNAAKKLGKALHQNGYLLLLDVRHNNLSKEAQRVLSTSAAARPRSSTGDHETLELRLEPNAPLLAAELVTHTPRDLMSAPSPEPRRRRRPSLAPRAGGGLELLDKTATRAVMPGDSCPIVVITVTEPA